jgi:hypothetical protein
MKTASLKIKRTIKANVSATVDHVKIKFPKQSLGCISIDFVTHNNETKNLRTFELFLCDGGEKVKAVAI